jgi:hypothetical protein
MKRLGMGAAFLLSGFGAAMAQPPPRYAPIPPPRYEAVPPSPGPRVLWEPGHWHWNGSRYVWVNGHYIERRPHRRQWVDGRWVWGPREGRWIWVPAHWR